MSVCFHIILGTIWAVACWLTILKVLYKKLLGTCICSPMSYFTKFFTPDVSSCCQHEFVTCSHIFKFWNRRLSFMPPGLPNTNWEKLSCFNSMLQVLSHTPKILECVESALASVHTESLHILKEIGSTFQKLTKADTRTSYWIFVKNSSTVSTISLRRAASAFCMVKQLTNVLENRPRQQDLPQLILWFLSLLHEALKMKPPTVGVKRHAQPLLTRKINQPVSSTGSMYKYQLLCHVI